MGNKSSTASSSSYGNGQSSYQQQQQLQYQQQQQANNYYRYADQTGSRASLSSAAPSAVVTPGVDYAVIEPTTITPFILLGSNYANKNYNLIKYLGITHILNMAMELSPSYQVTSDRSIKYKKIPTDDSINYNIRYHFEEAFQFMDEARASNGIVFVHCQMGISRSATIVIGYLMSRYQMPLTAAYNLVRSKRPSINPNPSFMKMLEQYEYDLYQENAYQLQLMRSTSQQTFRTPSYAASNRNSMVFANNY